MTAADLRDLFLARLLREAGGTRRRWRIALGEIRIYSAETHPHCNWSITPTGTTREIDAIERVGDDLRLRHARIMTG